MSAATSTRVMRSKEWSRPVRPVRREVVLAQTIEEEPRPPILFVPGYAHAAWVFEEHWLEHAAARGFPAYAMSLRGHGRSGTARGPSDLRAYVHDVVQVAATMPRQAVLVGHGAGALVVAHALARYPARAGVLLAPVFGGWRTFGTALLRNPIGTVPAIFGGRLRLRRGQLFGPNLHTSAAKVYLGRLGGASRQAQWQLLAQPAPESPVGDPPVLVAGSPDDRIVPRSSLNKVAARYGGAPLLFPGMGHDMMLDAGWAEPIDAIIDWLSKGER
ncbi:MAG TPA: alpha/beta fold hydrolase [Micromonosporaceae bacterium]|nr:alpha/beta fold hydrolase [Micromonosporaceae bacterium]